MKNLLVIPLLFLIACSTDSDTDTEFKPFKAGTWWVTSPDNADWVGSVNKFKSFADGDTLFIDSPDGQNLSIWKEEEAGFRKFMLTFTDSTVNRNMYEGSLKNELYWDNRYAGLSPFGKSGETGTASNEHINIDFSMSYQCDEDYQDPEILQLSLIEEDTDSLIRAYQVDVVGIIEAVEHVAC